MVSELLPTVAPVLEYIHARYLRFYMEQDVVGHMEADLPLTRRHPDRVSMAFCFVDLTGFTRFTEEEGDEEALDLVERFIETVEATLPADATIVKTIGDEVMIVSPDPRMLTEWAVWVPDAVRRAAAAAGRDPLRQRGLSRRRLLRRRRQPAHRVVARALAGEVLVTSAVVDGIGESEYLDLEPIGEVSLKGFPSRPSCSSPRDERRMRRAPAAAGGRDERRIRPPPFHIAACLARPRSRRSPRRSRPERVDRTRSSGVVIVSGGADSACAAAALVAPLRAGVDLGAPPQLRPPPRAGQDERAARALCAKLRVDLHVERPDLGERQHPGAGPGRLATRPPSVCGESSGTSGSQPVTPGPTSPRPSSTGSRPRRGPGRCSACSRGTARSSARCTRSRGRRRDGRGRGGPAVRRRPEQRLPAYARNRIRDEILPVLAEIGPEVERNIAATHAELHEEAELLARPSSRRRSPRPGRAARRRSSRPRSSSDGPGTSPARPARARRAGRRAARSR